MMSLLWAILIFFISTVIFDLLHLLLHRMQKSSLPLFKSVGEWHLHHHAFFDENLKNHSALWEKNFQYHLLPEFMIQIAVTTLFFFWFDTLSVLIAIGLEIFFFAYVIYHRGLDPNHSPPQKLRRPSMNFYIFPNYHAYHHRFPDAFYGSWFRFTDLIFGHSIAFKGQRVLLTGSHGELGKSLHQKLLKEGALVDVAVFGIDYTPQNFEGFARKAKEAQILILCHGSKSDMEWSHMESTKRMIDIFLSETTNPIPEIWGIGSEIEFHPALIAADKPYEKVKREYAKYASGLYQNDRIIYRHLVPAAFKSSYGPGLVSASFMGNIAFFFIKRGFRYIPLTYTGVAFFNYFKFKNLHERN